MTILLVTVLALVFGAYYATVLSFMWSWHVAPVFGLPELSIVQCYMITLMIELSYPRNQMVLTDVRKAKEALMSMIAIPITVLALGWACR